MYDMTCDEVQDAAAEFALDIIEADEREAVVAHIGCCPRCRGELVRMQESADRLLDLRSDPYPEAPVQVWLGEGVRPARRRFRMVATLAAAAVLMVGSTLGSEINHASGPTRPLAAAGQLMHANRSVGQVDIYSGSPQLIEVSVRDVEAKGRVTAELVTAAGSVGLGSFKLVDGTGYWATNFKTVTPAATAVQLIDEAGALVAWAALS